MVMFALAFVWSALGVALGKGQFRRVAGTRLQHGQLP